MLILSFLSAALFLCGSPARADKLSDGKAALLAAYSAHLISADGNTIVWQDGTTMQYDDGKSDKTFEEMLDQPDLQDQMSMLYPAGTAGVNRPAKNFDPGRIRYDPFFKKMYGADRQDVEKNLVFIRWMPKTVNIPIRVTTVNDVHVRLQRVSDELDQLPDRIKRYVRTVSGSYVWRTIAGTRRPSMHSFGVAIDIDARYADYWMWNTPDQKGKFAYRNKIPQEIVAIFEKHGFIWGGRWYHYDTMHFEYRPELLDRHAAH